MLNKKLAVLTCVCLCMAAGDAMGQAARSPFSSFGIGERFTNALVQQQGMAGVGISNPEYWYINNQNPALLVFNRVTVFQFGLVGEQRTQFSATASEKSGSGNLNYLALAVPIKNNKWSSSIALMPYTRLNYEFQHTDSISNTTNNALLVSEKGSGGINQFAWSNGVAITPEISVGLKAAYLFSSVSNEYSQQLLNTNQFYPIFPRIKERTFVSDFQFSPGVSIHLDSLFKNKEYKISFGAVWDIKTALNTKFKQEISRQTPSSPNQPIDSATLINNVKGHITVPNQYSAGITFGKGLQWSTTIEGSYADYSEYIDLSGTHPYSNPYWRLSGGFEFTPDPTSLGAYLKRLTYRTGVSLENYPYLVNGATFRDFGITFGLSLPVSRISTLDFAVKGGRRGDRSVNGLEENYFKIYFGITFNDQWFIKRRFD